MKCVLTCSGKTLPKWAYEQQEIACNPTSRDPNAMWNVEDNFYPKLPNVSFQNFAPGFVSRFIESHRVMLQGNAGTYVHPSLDIVNEPVRPLLFTISSRSLYQGKVFL